MATILEILQAMSNAAASNVSGPVDLIGMGMRKIGVPVPENAVGSSTWMKQRGLLSDVASPSARFVGESVGLLAPIAAVARAPQIASGLLAAQKGAQDAPIFAKMAPGKQTPSVPQREFSLDYPKAIAEPDGSRLARTIDGDALSAPIVFGRSTVGGNDGAIAVAQANDIARGFGVVPKQVPAKELGRGDVGTYRPEFSKAGRYQGREIKIRNDLDAEGADRTLRHEVSHLLDDLAAGAEGISAKGTSKELGVIYDALNKRAHNGGRLWDPKADGYKGDDVGREMWAEAIRAYMEDPNYIKTVAPTVAKEIRKRFNTHPTVSKIVQFNSAAGAGLLGYGMLGQGAED